MIKLLNHLINMYRKTYVKNCKSLNRSQLERLRLIIILVFNKKKLKPSLVLHNKNTLLL